MNAEPPAILIAWSSAAGAWHATAIVNDEGAAPQVAGPSTSPGADPLAALGALLGRRFGILTDADCPATLVTLTVGERTPAEQLAEAAE